jgi:hypothetical protein
MRKMLNILTQLLVLFALAVAVHAQAGPVCSVNTDTVPPNCSGPTWLSGLTCRHKTVTCPQVGNVTLLPLGITYGYKIPTGLVKGTIVILTGAGGVIPEAFPGAE